MARLRGFVIEEHYLEWIVDVILCYEHAHEPAESFRVDEVAVAGEVGPFAVLRVILLECGGQLADGGFRFGAPFLMAWKSRKEQHEQQCDRREQEETAGQSALRRRVRVCGSHGLLSSGLRQAVERALVA